MSHPVELFFHAVNRVSQPQVHWIGESWVTEVLPAFRARGWAIDLHDPSVRFEFFSLPKHSRDGLFVERVPSDWSGDQVQRLMGVAFQGLRPGGIFFLGFEGREWPAVLAWRRQAGFEAISQGSSGELSGVLARRLGGPSAEK